MIKRIVLCAEEGKMLTDGKTFGKCVYLAETSSADDYHEITKEEYDRMMLSDEGDKKGEKV